MDAGEFATIQELATAVGLAERHVIRQLRLAYLAPEVLKRLTYGREILAVSLYDLCFMAGEAGGEQFERVFDWSLMPRPQRSVTRACFLMERTFVQSAANAGSESKKSNSTEVANVGYDGRGHKARLRPRSAIEQVDAATPDIRGGGSQLHSWHLMRIEF